MFAARRVVSRSRDGEPRGSLREQPCRVPGVKWSRDSFLPPVLCSIVYDHLCPISAAQFRRTCVCAWRPVRVETEVGRERFEGRCRVSTKFAGDRVVFLGVLRTTSSVLCSKARFLREEEGLRSVSDRFYSNFEI